MHTVHTHRPASFLILILSLLCIVTGLVISSQTTTKQNTTDIPVFAPWEEAALLLMQSHALTLRVLPTPATLVGSSVTETKTKAEIEEEIVYLEKKLAQTDAEIVRITAELAVLNTELAAAKAALSGSVPVVVTPAPVVPTPAPVAETRGTYKAFTGTYVLATKDAVTELEALQNCSTVVSANPTKTIWCSFDAKVIYGRKPSTYVLGASTSSEIEDLEDDIASIERRLAVLIPRKASYEKQIADLEALLVVPVVVVPAPTPIPVQKNITPTICGSKPYLRKVEVKSATELKSALLGAKAGDYIAIAPGTYSDTFVLENKTATLEAPISICGETGVVIKSAKSYAGYGIHLKNVSAVMLSNVTVTGYMKGIMLDNAKSSTLDRLTVSNIAHEGIHLRQNSSNNIVQNSTVFSTGMVDDWYGEGIYIGSANSNWCTYTACAPDKSDWNQILNNNIYQTAAESVDIKEGTTGGIVAGNRFEGSSMTGEYADSFIDVKGNNYLIKGNTGTVGVSSKNVSYQLDAYQHHVVYDGYGNNNTFQSNTVTGVVPGYVVYLMSKGTGNVVTCDNIALTKAKGVTNVGSCKPI